MDGDGKLLIQMDLMIYREYLFLDQTAFLFGFEPFALRTSFIVLNKINKI